MLNYVWKAGLGSATIDCHFDIDSRTISACTTDGRVCVFDDDGDRIASFEVDLPAWGVVHWYDEAGALWVGVAEARKQPSSGAITLFCDGQLRDRVATDGPCWDVAIDGGMLWGTTWAGSVVAFAVSGKDPSQVQSVALGRPGYGLALRERGEMLVCVGGRGVARIDTTTRMQSSVGPGATAAAYNLVPNSDGSVFTGSTEPGTIVRISAEGHAAEVLAVELAGSVSGLALVDEFTLVAGDLDGNLGLFDIGQGLPQALTRIALPDGIWNLAIDLPGERLYVACGDGGLYSLALEAGTRTHSRAAIREAAAPPVVAAELEGCVQTAIDIAHAVMLIAADQATYDPVDLEALAPVVRSWSSGFGTGETWLLLGDLESRREAWHEAIVAYQRIPRSSHSFTPSLRSLAKAFERIGSSRTAANVLKSNLDRFPQSDLLAVLFEIGRLCEIGRDWDGALTAYEAVSSHDHAYPGLRSALDRLRVSGAPAEVTAAAVEAGEGILGGEVRGGRLSSRRRLEYDQISYIQYEYGPPADEAKKLLEEHSMASVASEWSEPQRSLDIGCATGRWPVWFARRGWSATGYDISPQAIDICERRAEQMPPAQRPREFHLYDICEGAKERAAFAIVTSMMGTFNHVPQSRLATFVGSIYDAIAPGGTFVFSSWNAASPFCEFLSLDSEKAKRDLRANALPPDEIESMLRAAGFTDALMTPIVYLPNRCYDVWEDDLDDAAQRIAEWDVQLRRDVGPDKAQMHFWVARKPLD